MKHIEVSRKIALGKKASAEELKAALITRLEKTIDIEKLTDGANEFSVVGTTGSPAGLTRHARIDLDVSIKFDAETARILISGYSRTARSLLAMYWILFLLMLVVGLLPGSIETSGDRSGAVDALVFLIFGIFIVMDVNKKLAEPQEFLETALQSLNTSYG
jgi:hypothetical protein